MTNSFFNFTEAADFASVLQASYDDINQSYERREQLERENDRTREINAAMPMKMIESLADFSISVKKASDKMKEDRYKKLDRQEYFLDDPIEDKKYTDAAKYLFDNAAGYNKALDTAIENKDVLAIDTLKNAPFAQLNDRMRKMQAVMTGVPNHWYTNGWDEQYRATTDPYKQAHIKKKFRESIEDPLIATENKRLVKNTVGRKIDNFLTSITTEGKTDLANKAKAEKESIKNDKLLQALDESNTLYTIENYKKDYAYEFENGMGGVSHDTIKRAFAISKVSPNVSTDQVKQLMKMDAGGRPYEVRYPVIAGEMHKNILKYEKEQKAADDAKNKQKFENKNEAALTYAQQQLEDGVDVEVIKRNLLEIQGNNKLAYPQFEEDKGIATFLDGLDQSFDSYIADNAEFEEAYSKGQLTVEEVEGSSFELQKKWLSRAQAQEIARQDSNYKTSRSSVEQIVKGNSNLWKQSSRGSLLPHANNVRIALTQKFEEEFTRLTDLKDPNAAANAALAVEAYWTRNGGGQVETSDQDGRLFVTNTEGIYENYMNSVAPATTRKNAETELTVDLYSTAVKLEMADNNIQQALDTPNVFLSEAEVMQEITRLASREGYSPKLKALASLYGKHEAVGGTRGILLRQAAVYGIPPENIPEELKSITEINSQGDPLINCLIREKGFEGLSTNQMLRQCAFISEKGTDDEELEIPKRPAFQ